MGALDGNAMAGELHALFGADLTALSGTCANCGATGPVAELAVYLSAGMIARCRSCNAVVIALVTTRTGARADVRGLAALGLATESQSTS